VDIISSNVLIAAW